MIPIVLIGTGRNGHQVAFTTSRPGQLSDLRGLDDGSARAVLAANDADLGYAARERIMREAEGNPLALVELPLRGPRGRQGGRLDLGQHGLPLTARLERAFSARLADLPQSARDAMLVAAVNDSDDLQEILAGASSLAGDHVGIGALEAAAGAGLISFDGLHARFRHPLVRSGVLQTETVTRTLCRHTPRWRRSLAPASPTGATWHRAQSSQRPGRRHRRRARGHARRCHWRAARSRRRSGSCERSAQLTTRLGPGAAGGCMLAAEHAFGLGRADLVDQLADQGAPAPACRGSSWARMEWLREIFNDGVPGDAARRVRELCDLALEAIGASESGLALNLLRGAALRCWWADTRTPAQDQVTEVAHLIGDGADDPRYASVLAVADPVRQGQEVTEILDGVVLETVADPGALWLLGQAAHAIGDLVRAADFLSRAETKKVSASRAGSGCCPRC